MAWPKAGTVAVTNGSNIVAGTGTSFFAAAQAGWGFVGPDGRVYEVASVQSGTELSLATPYQGATAGGQFYSLFPTMSLAHGLVASVQALIANFQGVADGPGAGKFSGDVVRQGDEDTGVSWPEGNAIALKAAGDLQLILKDGAASGEAVQVSPTDVTFGKLLTAGAFGFGAQGAPVPNGSFDNIVAAGSYYLTSAVLAASTLPPGHTFSSGSCLIQFQYNADNAAQILVAHHSGKMFTRIKDGGVWQNWREILDSGNKQQNAFDRFSGALLILGAFGLGGSGDTITDYSSIPGFSQFVSGGGANVTADAPPNGGAYKPGIVCYRSSSSRSSVLMFTTNGIAVRNYTDGVPDDDWIELSPPERGSNANGEYVRFADGTQICWGKVSIDHTDELSGPNRLRGLWTFPAGFIAPPICEMNCGVEYGGNYIGCSRDDVKSWGTHTGTTGIGGVYLSVFFTGGVSTSNAKVENIHMQAIGRWK